MTERIIINKPVAINRNTNEVYILNSLFKHNDGFKGATGSVLVPITQDYVDSRNDIEEIMDLYYDYWKQSDSIASLRDFCRDILIDCDGLFPGHDTSDCHLAEDLLGEFTDAIAFECIGGGRCFSVELFDIEGIEILDHDLVKQIKRYEGDWTVDLENTPMENIY